MELIKQGRNRRRLVCSVILTLLMAVIGPVRVGAHPQAPRIVPPHAHAYGKSYSQWQVAWWQWALSLPVDHHPLTDTAGCGTGQSSRKVWFIGGSFRTTTGVRDCTLPAGTALFFPILNAYAATLEGDGATIPELRTSLKKYFDEQSTMALQIDGTGVKDLKRYLVPPTPFIYGPLPENSIPQSNGYDVHVGDTSLALAEGVYVLLAPLPVGKHTIHFQGASQRIGFGIDFTYHITVVPHRRPR